MQSDIEDGRMETLNGVICLSFILQDPQTSELLLIIVSNLVEKFYSRVAAYMRNAWEKRKASYDNEKEEKRGDRSVEMKQSGEQQQQQAVTAEATKDPKKKKARLLSLDTFYSKSRSCFTFVEPCACVE